MEQYSVDEHENEESGHMNKHMHWFECQFNHLQMECFS